VKCLDRLLVAGVMRIDFRDDVQFDPLLGLWLGGKTDDLPIMAP
jgi:hypothetical protein